MQKLFCKIQKSNLYTKIEFINAKNAKNYKKILNQFNKTNHSTKSQF